MNNRLKVIIADDSTDFSNALCDCLAERENIQLWGLLPTVLNW